MLITLCCGYSAAHAAEISPFRTTDVESYLELRYLSDDRIDSNTGVEGLHRQQTTYEEEFSFLTHNYVFHPSFLKLDLGAGFTLKQDSVKTTYYTTSETNDGLYSLQGRASFLEKKPYPISLYYTRDNPVSFSGQDERVQQTNILYGFDFSLLEPVIPLNMKLFASHNDHSGRSTTNIIDDTTDSFGIRATKAYTDNYSHQFSFDRSEVNSRSGSTNNLPINPINPTLRITDILGYSSDWRFGAQRQIKYYDRASITRQTGPINRDEVSFAPNILWRHSDKLQSSYYYNYLDSSSYSGLDSSLNRIDTTNHSANATLNYRYSEQTEYDTGAVIENNRMTGISNRSEGVNGQVIHKVPFSNAELTLSARLGYRNNDRDAGAVQANVIGELVTLSGLPQVVLANENIISGSIIVRNLTLSQTYIEGIDYRIIVVGTHSEIQRLSGGSIGDPEQVVVDYAYLTGGSAIYTDIDQSYYAGLAIDRHYHLYLRYQLFDQKLVSGNPTLPLNSRNTLSIGATADYPLSNWVEVGANMDMVKNEEDISPYNSQSYGAYSQFALSYSSNLRLTANRVQVDNLNSIEDVDLTSYSMILRSRALRRVTMTVEAHVEEDTGGSIERKRDTFKLTAQWQVYRLIMNAQAVFSNDQTGVIGNERAHFMLTLRRDI